MSFDIVFVTRRDGTSAKRPEIVRYFKENVPFATVSASQVVYENEITEADFIIDFEKSSKAPMTLYLNLVRPSIWALEAADVLGPMADGCRLDVHDLQRDTRGPFDRDSFIASWNESNTWACKETEAPQDTTLPRAEIVSHWQWNRFAQSVGQEVGDVFFPRIRYRRRAGRLLSYVTAPVSQGTVFPLVDEVVLGTEVHVRGSDGREETTWEMSMVPVGLVVAKAKSAIAPIEGLQCAQFAANDPGIIGLASAHRGEFERDSGVWIGSILDREIFHPA